MQSWGEFNQTWAHPEPMVFCPGSNEPCQLANKPYQVNVKYHKKSSIEHWSIRA